MPEETDPPQEPLREQPTLLGNLAPDEMFARGMQSVKMTSGTAGTWQAPSVEEANRLFPNYTVISLLGRGGMGAVYKAKQTALDRFVAIKLLPLEISVDKDFADRFVREARAMARLNHPNIITVYDFGTTSEGHLYFVMEYVEGANLADIIHQVGLDGEQALSIVEQVCTALAYAHGKGIVHRDIKPANVMIDTERQVKVADFGLARLIDPSAEQMGHTMTGTVMGTPDYMAPEQMKGMNVDHRADIYSLGVMVYEMLCREVPRGIFHPPSHRTGCDERIDNIVIRAMQQAPEHRYQSTQEMKADVVEARVPVSAGPKPAVRPTGPAPSPPKKSATPLSPGQRQAPSAQPPGDGKATEVDSRPPSPPEPAVMKAIPPPAPKKSKLPLYGSLAAGLIVLGIGAAILAPKLGGTRSGVSQTSSAVSAGGNDGHAGATQDASPVWQRLFTDTEWGKDVPGQREFRDGLVHLYAKNPGTLVGFTKQQPAVDGAIRTRLHIREGSGEAALVARSSSNGGHYKLALKKDLRIVNITFFDRAGDKSDRIGADYQLPGVLAPGATVDLELRVQGDRLIGMVNGAAVIEGRDQRLAGVGDWGFQAQDAWYEAPDILRSPTSGDGRAEARPSEATKDAPFVNTLGMKFVPVPIVGGPTGGKVVLFSIWDTRVQDYEVFAKETKRDWPAKDFEQGPTHPAVMMTWEDAQAFCAWLTERERMAGKLPSDERYRLPTDHEWSCAVGIGEQEDATKTPAEKNGKINDSFPWGKQWPPPAGAGNYAGEEMRSALDAGKFGYVKAVIAGYSDGFVNTSPAGSFAMNRFGLFDMGGNVQQWCEDWFDVGRMDRVLRGASWCISNRVSVTTSNRTHRAPSERGGDNGFRCVLAPTAPAAAAARTIDLLPLVDLKRDVIQGTWSRKPEGLSLDSSFQFGVCQLPYQPPEEYDFETEFTPTSGGLNVNMHFRAGGSACIWKINAHGHTPPFYGLDMLDGKLMPARTEGMVTNPLKLEVGKRYTSRFEVRANQLRGLVNGAEIFTWAGDYKRLSTEPGGQLPDPRALAVGSYGRAVIFHRIEVREITGQGKLAAATNSPPAAASGAAAASLPKPAAKEWVVYDGKPGPGSGKHIVFLSGEEEYRSEESLPMLAKILSQRHGFKCTVLFAVDKDGFIKPEEANHLPGAEALDSADAIVMLVRWRAWPDGQMKHFADALLRGVPIIGLRTATHAFRPGADSRYKQFANFGPTVLGEGWVNHWGVRMKEGTRAMVEASSMSDPILQGVETIFASREVYEADPPADARILLRGQVLTGRNASDPPAQYKKRRTIDKVEQDINAPMMPVAWTRSYKNEAGRTNKILCTTMGAAEDWQDEGLRRLIVNGVYSLLNLPVPAKADVSYFGEYRPDDPNRAKKLKPSDLAL